MKVRRPHWSYSALQQYLRCPLQYYFERVLLLPKPTVTSGLVLGSAVHRALAYYHRSVQADQPAPINKVERVFAEAWNEQEQLQEIQFKSGETRTEQLAVGVGLLELYLEQPPPENIVVIERTLVVPLQNSQGEYLERPLLAVVDLVTRTGDGLKVHELKTSGRSYSTFEVESSLQATCYGHAVHAEHETLADIEYVVLVKNKQPKLQRIGTSRTEEDFSRLGNLVETVARSIDEEIFYPIESPMNCAGCPFRSECRDWKPIPHRSEPELHELNGAALC